MPLILLVDKEGNTQTVVKGIAGASCTQASAFLLEKLGTVTENTPTQEYYQSDIGVITENYAETTETENETAQVISAW